MSGFISGGLLTKRKKLSPDDFDSDKHDGLHFAFSERKRLQYESGRVYSVDFRIFVSYTGDTGVYAFMDQVRRQMSEEDKSLPAAILNSLNPAKISKMLFCMMRSNLTRTSVKPKAEYGKSLP